jgi:hypothetical protein
MNVVQLKVRSSRKLTLSPKMLKMMSGIPQMAVIVSKEQQIKSMMLETYVITCKFKQKFEQLRRKNKLKVV